RGDGPCIAPRLAGRLDMAYGPLAALIAMEQGQQLDLAAVNAALRADIAAAGGNSGFRSPAMTRTLDTLRAGGGTPGSSSVPQSSFDDLFPSPIPMSGVTATANATPASAASGGSPIATGLDVLLASFDMLMRSEEARRAGIDQQIDIANLFAQT